MYMSAQTEWLNQLKVCTTYIHTYITTTTTTTMIVNSVLNIV